MKKTKAVRIISVSALILLTVFSLWGCAADADDDGGVKTSDTLFAGSVVGQGNTSFEFTVTDLDGNDTVFTVQTDKETVGEALEDVHLISGENGTYGLYVKSVNGIVADYDVDGTYWAFYIDGEYALTGVDQTNIEDGVSYAFKIERS